MLAACSRFLLNPLDQPVLNTLRIQSAQFNLSESTKVLIGKNGSDDEDDGELTEDEFEENIGTTKKLLANILGKIEYLFEYASKWDKFVLGVGLFFTIVHAASFPILAMLFGKIANAYIIHTLEEQKNASIGSDTGSKDNIGLALSFLTKVTTSVGAGVNVSAIPRSTAVEGEGYFGNLNLYNIRGETNEDFATFISDFSVYYVYIGLAVFIASFMQTFTWESVAENQLYRIRQLYIFQLQRQQMTWFQARRTSSLVLKMADECERFREGVGQKFSLVVEYVVIAFFGAGIGFLTNAKLTFVFLASTPFIVSKLMVIWTRISKNSATAKKGYENASKIFSEALIGIRTVAANTAERNAVNRYKVVLFKGSKIAEELETLTGFGIGGMHLLIYAFYAVALWYSVNLLADGVITPGDICTVFFGITICAFAVGSLLPYLNCIAESFASKQLLSTVLNSIPDIDPYSMEGLRPRDFTGNIRFSNVTFAYPGREQKPVFKELDFEIFGRGTIGIVGGPGAGKATLIKLMQRFYDVQSGQVLFDKNDITTLNVRWVREQVSVINTKAVLLNDTILENIRSWRKDVQLHSVIRAAKKAFIHDYIKSLPKGYFTKIDNCGRNIPEILRIKMHIAKNILLDPKILILHKVLSVLDTEVAKIICQDFFESRKKSLTIIVDNKLRLVREAAFIFVFKDGTVVEQGTDQELVEQEGMYYRMLLNEKLIPECRIYSAKLFEPSVSTPVAGKPEEDSFMKSLGRLVGTMPSKLTLYLGFTGCVLTSLVAPLLTLCLGQILHMFVTSNKENLFPVGLYWVEMLTGLAVLAGVGYWSRTIFIGQTAERLSMTMRMLTFTSVVRQQVNWFESSEENAPTRVHAQLATNIAFVRNAIGNRLGIALSAILTMLIVLIISAWYSWQLALLASMIIPVMVGTYLSLQTVVQTDLIHFTHLRDCLVTQTNEIIRDVEAIQAINKASVICHRAERFIYPAVVQGHKHAAVYALVYATTECCMFFIFGLTFHFGAELIREGSLSIPNLFTVFFLLTFGSLSLGQATNFIPEWLKARHASKSIVKTIDLRSTLDPYNPTGLCPFIKGEIEFRNVWFDYKTKQHVLQGVNFKIPAGCLVAIVGPPGAGKSTLLLVLERFYDLARGQVVKNYAFIDGVNILDINPVYLRDHIGFVPQEPVLFDISIKDNITLGYDVPYEGFDVDARVEEAANFENAKFIKTDLPEQFKTRCGEQGKSLSFTQRQAVSWARASIKKPPIYLLDDPTGSLDGKKEKLVESSIIQGCTTLLVTNSYETIKLCQLVILLDDGKLVEVGNPLELLKSKETALYHFLEGQGTKMDDKMSTEPTSLSLLDFENKRE